MYVHFHQVTVNIQLSKATTVPSNNPFYYRLTHDLEHNEPF
jgi:hypothetical protein